MAFLLARVVPSGTIFGREHAVPTGTTQGAIDMKSSPPAGDAKSTDRPPTAARDRILGAAFALLHERGYAATSTREIAARARLSKRELYAEFGSKEGIFGALIETRAARMRQPLEEVAIGDRAALAATLRRAGAVYVQLLCDPAVVAIFRLTISAVEHAPELSRIFKEHAYAPYRRLLQELMA